MQRHPAPPAAHVQQPHPRAQRELAGDEFVFRGLRLFQGETGAFPHRAGIGHRRAQHDVIERVGHVVVVGDRGRVPPFAVPPAAWPRLLRRRRQAEPPPPRGRCRSSSRAAASRSAGRSRRSVGCGAVPATSKIGAAVDVQVTGDIRAGDAQLPRRQQHPADRVRRPHPQHRARPDRPQHRPVVGLDADRYVAAEEPAQQDGHRHRNDRTDARTGAGDLRHAVAAAPHHPLPGARIATRMGLPPLVPVRNVVDVTPSDGAPEPIRDTRSFVGDRHSGDGRVSSRATRIGTFGADPAGRPSTAHPGQIIADDRASPAV